MFNIPRKIPGLPLAALLAATLAAGPLAAAERMVIHFADIGNIRTWHAVDSNQLYVQSLNRDWYRITFWSPCHELPFALGIAFVTDTLGDLDKYSSILVNGERCWFRTFQKSDAPPDLREKTQGDVP